MPLSAVTSENRSVRAPSWRTTRSLRNRRSARGPRRGKTALSVATAVAEHLTLHQVDVEIAVVVVVEQPHARAHDLRVVQLSRHPVEVHEIDPRRFGPIDEPLAGRWRGRRPLGDGRCGRGTAPDYGEECDRSQECGPTRGTRHVSRKRAGPDDPPAVMRQ